jgi:hypothetical protein
MCVVSNSCVSCTVVRRRACWHVDMIRARSVCMSVTKEACWCPWCCTLHLRGLCIQGAGLRPRSAVDRPANHVCSRLRWWLCSRVLRRPACCGSMWFPGALSPCLLCRPRWVWPRDKHHPPPFPCVCMCLMAAIFSCCVGRQASGLCCCGSQFCKHHPIPTQLC